MSLKCEPASEPLHISVAEAATNDGLSPPPWPEAMDLMGCLSRQGDAVQEDWLFEPAAEEKYLFDEFSNQGYLAYKKPPPPSDHHRPLGIVLLWGPRGVRFLMSEVPL